MRACKLLNYSNLLVNNKLIVISDITIINNYNNLKNNLNYYSIFSMIFTSKNLLLIKNLWFLKGNHLFIFFNTLEQFINLSKFINFDNESLVLFDKIIFDNLETFNNILSYQIKILTFITISISLYLIIIHFFIKLKMNL